MKDITKKWIELAEYDFVSAKVMLGSKRYLYVTFMCQQTVEKYLKAILTETSDEPPPYTHNLVVLAEMSQIPFSNNEKDFLSNLSRHYIRARYPGIKETLSSLLNKKTATILYDKTKEMVGCFKKKLKISRQ